MSKAVLRVQDLAVTFTSLTGGPFRRKVRQLRAVDGISFELHAGETLQLGDARVDFKRFAAVLPANSPRRPAGPPS